MKTLVTGGAGFIGWHLVKGLLAQGQEVRVVDDLSSKYPPDFPGEVDMVIGDIADPATAKRAVDGVQTVFHQAAHRAVQRSVDNPLTTDRVNTFGTLNILAACRENQVKRFVYASSSSVYGAVDVFPTPETSRLLPSSPYAVSKLAGEHYARVFWELYGVETVGLRYFNVYGPRQSSRSKYAQVVPLFIEALIKGEPLVIYGDGLQSRDFTYIEDVVNANLLAAASPGEACSGNVYNIAGGRSFTLLELTEVLGEVMSTVPVMHFEAPRPGDVRRTEADISAASFDLGHNPRTSLKDGLRSTVEWFSDTEV